MIVEKLVNNFVIPDKTFKYFGDIDAARFQKVQKHELARKRANILCATAGGLLLIASIWPGRLSAFQDIQPGDCQDGWTYLGGDPEVKDQRGRFIAWAEGCDTQRGDSQRSEQPVVVIEIPVEVPGETVYIQVPAEATPEISIPIMPTPIIVVNERSERVEIVREFQREVIVEQRPYPPPIYPITNQSQQAIAESRPVQNNLQEQRNNQQQIQNNYQNVQVVVQPIFRGFAPPSTSTPQRAPTSTPQRFETATQQPTQEPSPTTPASPTSVPSTSTPQRAPTSTPQGRVN